ncbi:phosphopantetheine-binding protein [Rhodonellum psychrophilum GCM71 = DSM 17998]|uniref:Phosphopantetheine-binding protein n=2 Tax=Rhodonellum TaxID=336827 RepID=U5BUD6_9BACT|nr:MULTISPECIES: phosphopantetheine-binding protein [Rhodonellum]ERM81149.1 phosphopantetheine-binding protein [Rhodonellum psychrophilum GCM71 = DSM 17998]MDO9554191.1 phosphopantetheine-binding protein [Rhodonellum sp.]SDZ20485.1 acyl carrier protein [Rhodonellum ikkaensis]
MNKSEILNTIHELLKNIAPEMDPTLLGQEENIREALNIDSYDALQFIVALCEKLKIDIPEQDYGKTATIKSLLTYLEKKII